MTYSVKKFKETKITFSPDEYSRFKYGDDEIARIYGTELAKLVIPNTVDKNDIVVVCSPYQNIPTASAGMVKYFVREFNRLRVFMGLKVVQELKMYREKSYVKDYGAMTVEDRKKYIASDKFHLDLEFLKGKHVLFADDCRITGTHENIVREYLKDVTEFTYDFLYYAELTESCIDPTIESRLNFSAIKTDLDFICILKTKNHILNVRTIKKILGSDTLVNVNFCKMMGKKFIRDMMDYIYADNYHLVPVYRKNIEFLESYIQ